MSHHRSRRSSPPHRYSNLLDVSVARFERRSLSEAVSAPSQIHYSVILYFGDVGDLNFLECRSKGNFL
jgi:hypothetical protein